MSNKIKINEKQVSDAIADLEAANDSSSIAAEDIVKITYDSEKLKPSIKKQMNEIVEELATQLQQLNANTETFIQNLNNIMEKIKEYNEESNTLVFSDKKTYSSNMEKDVWGLLNIFKEAGLMSGGSIFSSATIASAGTFFPTFSTPGENSKTWNSREEWQNDLIAKYKNKGYSQEEAQELSEYEMAAKEYAATGANVFGKDKVALSSLYESRREIIKSKIETLNIESEGTENSTGVNQASNKESTSVSSRNGEQAQSSSSSSFASTSTIKARVEEPSSSLATQQKVESTTPVDIPTYDTNKTPSVGENTNQPSNSHNNNEQVEIPSSNDNSETNNVNTNPGLNVENNPPINTNQNTNTNTGNHNTYENSYYNSPKNNMGNNYNNENYTNSTQITSQNQNIGAENISTTTPSAPESDTNIIDKSGEELDVISIDRDISNEPSTSASGGSVIPAVLGVGAAGVAAVAGIKLINRKKEKENTYDDENSFTYLNNDEEENDSKSTINLNEELE